MDARFQDAQTERLAQSGALQAEISVFRSEIGALRSETNAEFGEFRSAYSSLVERMLRTENLIEDRRPSPAP